MSEDRTLEERVSALEAAVEELGTSRRRASTPFGRVVELAVPVGLAAVEAQLRTMDAVLDTVAPDGDGVKWSRVAREESDAALERLDGTLQRLERKLESQSARGGRDVGELLGEIRGLQSDIQARIDSMETDTAADDGGVRIDVESELDTIRDEVDAEDDG